LQLDRHFISMDTNSSIYKMNISCPSINEPINPENKTIRQINQGKLPNGTIFYIGKAIWNQELKQHEFWIDS